jgi:hypothetical protein
VIDRPLLMVKANEPVAVPELSWTVIPKLLVPAAVGVPDSRPLEAFNDKPTGKEPEVTDQVYEPLPPPAEKVKL